jgi:C-methyltransferase C-terminal domain/Methyltransferase domain
MFHALWSANARAHGIETIDEFFNSATAQRIRQKYGPARAVIANNVLAHVDETQDFLRGCRNLLEVDGLVVVEVPYVGDLLERLEYDTIYHEHLCYFSISSLLRVCEAVGLIAVRVDRVTVHGGSIRLYAGLPEAYGTHAADVTAMAQSEDSDGLTDFSRFERFAARVDDNRRALRTLLVALTRERKTVAGYGAPAKGNTLLNYCHIDTDLMPYTVDRSPLKISLYTPGTHIPVLVVSTLLERQPDYVLILAWNFADEIMRQQQEYLRRGGRIILPIPEARIV